MLSNLLTRWTRERPRADCPVIGAMATMPTRLDSFRRMLDSILPQLDRLYVFLDGYDEVPAFLSGRPACRVEHIPAGSGLHNASRFLVPARHAGEAIFVFLDDDLVYPRNYIERLVAGVHRHDCKAIVGFHGSRFVPPHASFVRDTEVMHFAKRLNQDVKVDLLGAGTLAFHSSTLRPAPDAWPHPRLDDLNLAAEAVAAKVDLIALRRPAKWLRPIAQGQPDSIWRSIKQDDRLPTRLMREIVQSRADAQETISQQASWGPRTSDPAGV